MKIWGTCQTSGQDIQNLLAMVFEDWIEIWLTSVVFYEQS